MAAHPQSFEPSTSCLERAAFLSRIVYFDPASAKAEVIEYQSELRFKFVNVKGVESQHQVVCAKDYDNTLFICFRGSRDPTDFLTNALVDQRELRSQDDFGAMDGSIKGRFHHGFGLSVNQYNIRLLRSLCESKHSLYGAPKKLVFCGHSLGGALAHMALIKYIVGIPLRFEEKFGAISIGFGAPHICDPQANDYLTSDYQIDDRIFNYVTPQDPVPRFLNNLPQSVRKSGEVLAKKMKPLLERVMTDQESSYAHKVTTSLKWLLSDCTIDFGLDFLGLKSESLLVEAANCISALAAAGLEVKTKWPSHSDCVWYVPLGKWRNVENLELITPDQAKEELRGRITEEHLQSHRMAVYFNKIMSLRRNIDRPRRSRSVWDTATST